MVTFSRPEGVEGEVPEALIQRANEMYWNSGASVNRLARELDLSKGALYGILAPYPAGLPCPTGDGELCYTNRTARTKGFVSCSSCGLEEEEAIVRAVLEREGETPELQGPRPAARVGGDRSLEHLMAGSALVGLAVGLLLGHVFRRR